MTTAPHLVLSMDTGIDDALALAYLVAAGARIDGVSATYGNVLQHIGLADEVVAIAFLRERASHEHDARP